MMDWKKGFRDACLPLGVILVARADHMGFWVGGVVFLTGGLIMLWAIE